jgi:hypothetical protein
MAKEKLNKTIYFGRFSYTYGHQYYRTKNKRLIKDIKPVFYKDHKDMIYLEGEEDKAWDKIVKKLGDTEKKRLILQNKKVEVLANTGKTMY